MTNERRWLDKTAEKAHAAYQVTWDGARVWDSTADTGSQAW